MKDKPIRRILIIEDDAHIAEGLKLNLSLQNYDVQTCGDGATGLQTWKDWHPDLIVLDLMLPAIDGISVLRNIRLQDERIPVLILTAKGAPDDRVRGFASGADDYLPKPFHLEEFLLRVDRLLKRLSWSEENSGREVAGLPEEMRVYRFGGNVIDFEKCTASCRAGEIRLTDQEIKLLKIFVKNPEKPMSRNRLLEIGWGYTRGTSTRTVDNFLVRFRKYFEENPKEPEFFKSLRSVGYVFIPDSGKKYSPPTDPS
jgi:two-component system, OmpR family, alkaline phosphatase synthesis response regulator PhoP